MEESQFSKQSLVKKRPLKLLFTLVTIIFISLLPGIIVSLALFINAMFHDVKIQNLRNAIANTDLSQVRIEGYALGIQESKSYAEQKYCTYFNENGIRNRKNNSIELIRMDYPIINFALSFNSYDEGEETWQKFTIKGKSIPDFESAVETLGENFATVEKGRSSNIYDYKVFIDRENDLELRFYYSYDGSLDSITLMRVDNRSGMEYLHERNELFDDQMSDIFYGIQIFDILSPHYVYICLKWTFLDKRFLYIAAEYFYIPIYFFSWTFPLIWALHKRRIRWSVLVTIWYVVWYLFCNFTFIARQ